MLELALEMLAVTCGEKIKHAKIDVVLSYCVSGVLYSHGMSYPISANVQSYRSEGYNKDKALIVS